MISSAPSYEKINAATANWHLEVNPPAFPCKHHLQELVNQRFANAIILYVGSCYFCDVGFLGYSGFIKRKVDPILWTTKRRN